MKKLLIPLIALLMALNAAEAQNCEAAFGYDNLTDPTTSNMYIFYDLSPQDPNDPIIDWTWDIGGVFTFPGTPTIDYVFDLDGVYEVCLTIITESGCTSTYCEVVEVITVPDPCFLFPSFFAAVNGNDVSFTPFTFMPLPDMSYSWDFGDGATSTDELPIHTYAAAGDYTVCLVMSTPDCPPATYCNNINILDPSMCQANFFWDYQWENDTLFLPPLGIPSTVCFTNNSSGNVVDFEWVTENGDVYTDEDFCETFAPGPHEICLSIITDSGCTDTQCQTFFVEEPFCQPNFGVEVDGYTVSFMDYCGFDAVVWNWDFGDGNTSNLQNPTHTYAAPGNYEICLSVVTSDGCEGTLCQTVNITDPANCQAHFLHWQEEIWDPALDSINIFGGSSVCFQSNSSGSPNSWLWDFGDGSTGTDEFVCHEFPGAGVYEVCLTIANSVGCTSTICNSVAVEEIEPYCQPFFGYEVNGLTVSFFDFCWLPATAWEWTFGDGGSSTEQNPTYTYAAPGEYEICLTATTDGCTATYCETVIIADPSQCSAQFTYWYDGPFIGPDGLPFDSLFTNGLGVCFQSYAENAGSHEWSFGDGNFGDGEFICHTYDAAGEYEVCLAVSNDFGCADTLCHTITVEEWEPYCMAEFIYEQNVNSVMFNDASWAFSEAVSWNWDFGDGQNSTEQHPEHAYTDIGIFDVCLTVTFADGCENTVCHSIEPNGVNGCEAWFVQVPDPTLPPMPTDNYCFQSISAGTGNLTWDFGDGTTQSGGEFVCHNYNLEGTYAVCLIVENAFGCISEYCLDIIVGTVIPFDCELWVEVLQDAPDNPTVYFATFGTTDFDEVVWDFGDGTTGTSVAGDAISHIFPGEGDYEVCATGYSSIDSCSATNCQMVYINSGMPTVFDLCGYVTASDAAIPVGTEPALVYLIEMDPIGGTLTAVDSLVTPNDGTFCFDGLNLSSTYFLKATLLPDSPNYPHFLPTYYSSALHWYEATPIVPDFPTTVAAIIMIAGDNPGGPGFIGGLITEGAGKAEGGTGLPNVEVILLNEAGEPVAYTFTDEEGNYLFENIAYGTYTVVVEMLNKESESFTLTIDADNPNEANADFEVMDTEVFALDSTGGIDNTDDWVSEAGLLPNPASGQTTVAFTLTKSADIDMTVTDITGRLMSTQKQRLAAGSHQLELELDGWASGVYLVRITGESDQASKLLKLVVK